MRTLFSALGLTLSLMILCSASLAQQSRQLLHSDPLPSGTHLEIRLHGGEYHVETSRDASLHVTETRDEAGMTKRATDVVFHQTGHGARLEVDPPLNNHSETKITLALPACAALNLRLTAGQLVFETVPCEATEADLHAGDLRVSLGDADAYRSVRGSVSIGQVEAKSLGPGRSDEQHGGFFRSFERKGPGTRTFAAHIGSGQITLEGRHD